MGPKQLAAHLKHGLSLPRAKRRPKFISGPPGVGKSSIVAQVARDLGREICDVRAVLLDPVDFRGIPKEVDMVTHWCPPSFLPQGEGEGVLFLDELAQAPQLVQSACLQLCLDRRLGEYQLPDGWDIVAASNRQEDRAGASKMITPLLNRFIHYDLEVSHTEWMAWALQNNIHADVTGFLRMRPELLMTFDAKSNARAFASPRSWEFLSDQLDGLPLDMLIQEAIGSVGEGVGAEFVGYCKLKHLMPDPLAVIAHPDTIPLPGSDQLSVLWALIGALVEMGRTADHQAIAAMIVVANRIPQECAALFIRDLIAVNPAIVSSSEAVRSYVRANKDVLSMGA